SLIAAPRVGDRCPAGPGASARPRGRARGERIVDPRWVRMRPAAGVLACFVWHTGCAGLAGPAHYRALDQQLGALEGAPVAPAEASPFAGVQSLERSALVAEVLKRNPSIASALQAWRAALARYPQQT